MTKQRINPLTEVAKYYSAKLAEFGETPQGVDWNSSAGQQLRFEQLGKLFAGRSDFSLNDIGCGYGAFWDFLNAAGYRCSYLGVDVSEAMVERARKRYNDRAGVRFLIGAVPDENADYSVASGIFNVRLGCSEGDWIDYIKTTLDAMANSSLAGFAFNCLTSYSDPEKMRADLYYADPCWWFDYCKRRFSRNVALLHDYDLYEFTIIVRKST